MDQQQFLTEQFEAHRDHLRAVGHRMLGSAADADDAVQEAWLRLNRTDVSDVQNLGGWLTTVLGRVCLDMLRSRTTRREDPLDEPHRHAAADSPDTDPEQQAVLADSVGVALLVVLDTLGPDERLAFVLHDLFGVPFDEIAPVLDRTPAAARQLASRGRRRIRGATAPARDLQQQRRLVEAFLAASREGRFDDLLSLLAPDVALRADQTAVAAAAANAARGAPALAAEMVGAGAVATAFAGRAQAARQALLDGVPAAAWAPGGALRSVFAFEVADGKITSIEIITDPAEVRRLDVRFTEV